MVAVLLLQAGNIPLISPVINYDFAPDYGVTNFVDSNTGGLYGTMTIHVKPPLILADFSIANFFQPSCAQVRISDKSVSVADLAGSPLISVKNGSEVGTINVCVHTNSWNINELKKEVYVSNFENVPPWTYCVYDVSLGSHAFEAAGGINMSALQIRINVRNSNAYPVSASSFYVLNKSSFNGNNICFIKSIDSEAISRFLQVGGCYVAWRYPSENNAYYLELSDSVNGARGRSLIFKENLVLFDNSDLISSGNSTQPVIRVYRVPDTWCK